MDNAERNEVRTNNAPGNDRDRTKANKDGSSKQGGQKSTGAIIDKNEKELRSVA